MKSHFFLKVFLVISVFAAGFFAHYFYSNLKNNEPTEQELLIGAPGEWALFRAKESRFEILFPGKPAFSVHKANGGDINTYNINLMKEGMGYTVNQAPRNDSPRVKPETLMNEARDEFVNKTKGALSVKSETSVKAGKYPGLQLYLMNADGSALVRTLIVVTDKDLYQVTAAGLKEKFLSKQTEDFFSSFRAD